MGIMRPGQGSCANNRLCILHSQAQPFWSSIVSARSDVVPEAFPAAAARFLSFRTSLASMLMLATSFTTHAIFSVVFSRRYRRRVVLPAGMRRCLLPHARSLCSRTGIGSIVAGSAGCGRPSTPFRLALCRRAAPRRNACKRLLHVHTPAPRNPDNMVTGTFLAAAMVAGLFSKTRWRDLQRDLYIYEVITEQSAPEARAKHRKWALQLLLFQSVWHQLSSPPISLHKDYT